MGNVEWLEQVANPFILPEGRVQSPPVTGVLIMQWLVLNTSIQSQYQHNTNSMVKG
jgi:hypothetical protein